jgi:hypothetical protein
MRYIGASPEQQGAMQKAHFAALRAKVAKHADKYRLMLSAAQTKLDQLETQRECSNAAIGSGADRRMARYIKEQREEIASIEKIMADAGVTAA